MKTSLYTNYRKRIRALVLFVICLNAIFLFRIFSIQIIEHSKYKNILNKETVIIKTEQGPRGKIYDRNNIELADNITRFDFWVNTSESEKFDKQAIARIFSKTFNKNISHYLNLLNNENHYVKIEKNIEEIYCRNILDSISTINGLRCDSSLKRFYPYDNLTANIVGFFNNNNSSGIENYFNKILSGKQRDVQHQILDNQKIKYNNEKIPSGKNIVLTIDLGLQTVLVNELKKGMVSSGANAANGIIVDPYTGDVLAMASIPDFNANRYGDFGVDNYKNRVVSDSYEPGSTYKIVALTAAIENLKIDLKDSLYCEDGLYKLQNGHLLHDHESHKVISISDIFAFSSNIGMAKIADLLSNQQLYDKSREFGFGVNTGILLPNEESGMLRVVEDWSYQSNKSLAMGQEVSCTSLQLAMAYSSIANGGYLLQPSIIKYIDDKPLNDSPIIIRRVMKRKTSAIMLDLLERVVNHGSGSNAYLEGYRLGGKTGTAQKFIDGKYSDSNYISSFVSVFPIENPKYVCVISVDSPDKNRGKHWGNETAAPIIKEIHKKIINLKNIKPETFVINTDTSTKKVDLINKVIDFSVVPDFRGKTLKQALKTGKDIGIEIKPVGYSGRVVWQSIKAGSKINDIKICELKVE